MNLKFTFWFEYKRRLMFLYKLLTAKCKYLSGYNFTLSNQFTRIILSLETKKQRVIEATLELQQPALWPPGSTKAVILSKTLKSNEVISDK